MFIEAKGLTKIYGNGENQVVALQRADLRIMPGDFISIMGPSGSGKSTLLHLLSGLDQPTDGKLYFDGQDIYSLSDKELSAFRRRRIGFIFQQFNLLPVLTARENILMPILLDGKKSMKDICGNVEAVSSGLKKRKQKRDRQENEIQRQRTVEERLEYLAHMLGIQDRLFHLPHELSGGQQQRVAIARALIAEPDIIFADEPTGNLDSKSGGEVMKMLENVHEEMGKTLVVITHDSRIAQRAERKLVIMDGGLSGA